MAIVKHKVPGGAGSLDLYIWAETANINYFIKTPLTPLSAGGVTNKTAQVKAFTRRQYPGDSTPINVSASNREFIVDPGARSGAALPGKNFWLVADAGLPGEEKRQFTYQGRLMDLHAWLVGTAKYELYLYGPTGKRYIIEAAPTTP